MAERPSCPAIETDVVIIGAGPVGLFQVFQLGLLDIRCHVIDALPCAGGQPMALYPGKPIFDIPGVPICTGQELTDNLLRQCAPFQATFHLGQTVQTLAVQDDGRYLLETHTQTRLLTRAVVIAAGVGAFQPKELKAPGVESLGPSQLVYHPSDTAASAGQNVLVIGGDDAAVSHALALSKPGAARAVTLLHRRSTHQVSADTARALQNRQMEAGLARLTGQVASVEHTAQGLVVQITPPEGPPQELRTDKLAVFLGLSPKLGPIAEWGLAMARKQLTVRTEDCGTDLPGVFAVGDVNTYPGKKKLIVCGFHECVMAAFGLQAYLCPEAPALLQYTTSSTKLHRLLGVESSDAT